jgi:hypothetical protein
MKYQFISVTGKIFLSLLCLCLLLNNNTSAQTTANSFSSYIAYNGAYRYGANPGYYGSNWGAKEMAILAMGSASYNVKGAGVKSLRVPLYDDFLTRYGLTAELPKFQQYASLGGGDFTAFVGSPYSTHREPTTFPGSTEQAKVFKGLYEPVWLDAAQTQVNPNNTYAKYLYDVVRTYGQYVKFWEIVNEPDFTYSSSGWLGDSNPPGAGSWFDHNPTAAELVNLRAPIFYYIRTLRVSWEVIKKLQPDDYICTGGIGYRSFLDAILRNTDNPSNGSVTSQYPLKGGAYFDILSFHNYPMFGLKTWSSASNSVQYVRHSDGALNNFITTKINMDNLLGSYGYNGSTYPKKQFICTETGVSRIMSGDKWGSNEGQKNYMIKAQVASQKSGIKQTYWFQLGDKTNTTAQFDQMGLYKYFGSSVPYNATPSDQGIALKTTSDLLYGRTYDAGKTSSLNLPSSVDGGAFRGADGTYVYVLWAKTKTDLSEVTSATYSFPSTIALNNYVSRREWNFSQTKGETTIAKTNISLSGSPSFFTESTTTSPAPSPIPVASAIPGKVESEGYSNMYGVKTQTTSDAGGGLNVGWIDRGDWMDYPVNVSATATYKADFRVATAASGAQLQIKNQSGVVLATLNVPNTGGYQSWQTVSVNLPLTAGAQTLKVYSSSASGSVFNVNWMNLSTTTSSSTIITAPSTSTGSTTKIEAERYASMYGVKTESTSDAGGGLNVGWIDNADWMNYSYSAPASGSYTIRLRVATPNNGAQLQIKNQSGAVLATVNVPNTGAYQSYQTVSATINLSAGTQTLKVQSSASAVWNFNWIELVSPGSTTTLAAKSTTTQTTTEATASAALEVFPNPVTDRFALQINNELSGALTVQVINLSGALVKQFSLNKAAAGTSQFYLSIGELPQATYIIKASMANWTQSTQIVKQ